MSSTDLVAILPLLVLSVMSVAVLLGIAVRRHHGFTFFLTLAAEIAALAAIPVSMAVAPHQAGLLIEVDRYSLFFTGLLIAGSLAVTLFAFGYLSKREIQKEEFYVLLLVATAGSVALASSRHFISLFLGLEILSVSLYTMIAYPVTRPKPLEAALKYLILAGISTAFLVFGMALVYVETGTMEFPRIAAAALSPTPVLMSGFALIVVGIGFKLALAPFHMWTPDVYQGAPAPVAALVASVSKGAVFALLLRYFGSIDVSAHSSLFMALAVLSMASMIAGNFLALMQKNLKRILAYSSIAHLGYLLVAFLASRDLAVPASSYYLAAYFISILAAFGVISVLSRGDADTEALEDYQGLFWRRPWLAVVLSASMFSLAGIPLTAGFLGKFYVLVAGIGSAHWLLVLTLVITSAIGLFYYLRVIVALYTAPAPGFVDRLPAVHWPANLMLAGLMILLIWLGVYPSPIMAFIQSL